MHDVPSIYLIPESMREAGIDREVLTMLDLHDRVNQRAEDQNRSKWRNFVDQILKPKRNSVQLAVTGKYVALRDAYASIIKAAEHCSAHLNVDVQFKWLDTTEVAPENVEKELAVYQVREGGLVDTQARIKLDAGPVSIRTLPR